MVLKDVLREPVLRRVSVRWGEMDAFQHVNNTVYFKYFESKSSSFSMLICGTDRNTQELC